MAFNLFGGKKPTLNETALVKKVEARKQAEQQRAKASPEPAPPPAPPSDAPSLDFTNFAPAPGPVRASPPSVAPAPASVAPPAASIAPPPLDLDFFGPTSAAAEPKPAEKPAAAKRKVAKPVDSILCIEVESGTHEVPPVIEEGAILFANGQAKEALERLTAALAEGKLGAWQLQAWLMIFDLYQHLGRKAEFEEKALEFVVKFERSPPIWADVPTATRAAPSLRTGGAAHIALTGTLGAASAAAMEQLKKTADKQQRLRLDFTKLQGLEPAGCRHLLEALRALRAAKRDVFFTGEAQLLKLLREIARAGERGPEEAPWLLLFDIYQELGLQNEFEEAAVDYAVTYEVSPPSWEVRAKAKPALGASQPVATATSLSQPIAVAAVGSDDVFHVEGEIAGQNEQVFADLGSYAARSNPVIVDMTRARRIDFVNAGRLLNVLEKLKQDDRPIVIRGANEMVIALFAVMGIPKVARIIPRK